MSGAWYRSVIDCVKGPDPELVSTWRSDRLRSRKGTAIVRGMYAEDSLGELEALAWCVMPTDEDMERMGW